MNINLSKYYKKTGQRQKIIIDNYDTWSVDNTLAPIIFPLLIQLKQEKQGYPSELGENIDYDQYTFDLETDDRINNTQTDIGVKKWDAILDKMIWSFYQIIIDDQEQYYHGESDYKFIKNDTGHFEMKNMNPDKHWVDQAGLKMYHERIDEGLALFGKYFRSLWT